MSKRVQETSSNPIVRNSSGLRDAIFDEIDAIRIGKSNPTRANAVAKLAAGIVETVRMEIEVQRHLRALPSGKQDSEVGMGGALGAPLTLGNDR